MASYITAAPELGGHRYGPYYGGSLYVGSDPSRAQVVIASSFGVAPMHAMITDLNNGTFQVQPVQMGLSVFCQQVGVPKVYPVQGGVQLSSGDSFMIGGPRGPRFTLEYVAIGPVQEQSGGFLSGLFGGRGKGISSRLGQEVSRQAQTSALTSIPLYREAYRFYSRARTGAYAQPRYIISAVGAVVVLIGGLAVGCMGSVATLIASLAR